MMSATLPAYSGQTSSCATILGVVTHAYTEKPLDLVNVFLAGTTLGDATDRDGRYVIRNVQPGTYELVASFMGYEIQKIVINISECEERIAHFTLHPKIIEGGEVTVIADAPLEWRKNLKIFERVFFGVKKFADDCKLMNPEVLDFSFDRGSGQFQAVAKEPITFVNNALGYEVIFVMKEFSVRLYEDKASILVIDGQRYKKDKLRLKGVARFRELVPKTEQEGKKWEQNRLVAYKGSLRHFLKTLCEGRLKEEGYEIRGAKTLKFGGREVFSPRSEYKVRAESLVRQAATPFQRILSFPDYLKVTYYKEKDEIKYETRMLLLNQMKSSLRMKSSDRVKWSDFDDIAQQKSQIEKESAYQVSWLKINNGESILISTNGLVIPGQSDLTAFGYWYWEGADEWLPTDYLPTQEERRRKR
jgi:hypothetical protein